MSRIEPQSLAVKRAQVEFHKFASLGDFERVVQTYAEENLRRRGILLKHRDFIGPLSPFLESRVVSAKTYDVDGSRPATVIRVAASPATVPTSVRAAPSIR